MVEKTQSFLDSLATKAEGVANAVSTLERSTLSTLDRVQAAKASIARSIGSVVDRVALVERERTFVGPADGTEKAAAALADAIGDLEDKGVVAKGGSSVSAFKQTL